ncbi:sigma factor [Streptomyces sp. NPDC002523]
MVQETLLAAWRGLGGFRGRSSVRAWLYHIATNRCLYALRDTGRRPQPRQPARRPDLRRHPLRRQRPLPSVRAAANAPRSLRTGR